MLDTRTMNIPDRQDVIDLLKDDGLSESKAGELADAVLQLARADWPFATVEALEALHKGASVDDVIALINKHLSKLQ